MTSMCHPVTSVVSVLEHASKAIATIRIMKLRKRIANKILGSDVDDLCLAWYNQGLADGYNEGIDATVEGVITDLLSDAGLSMDVDVELMQRIVNIIEN